MSFAPNDREHIRWSQGNKRPGVSRARGFTAIASPFREERIYKVLSVERSTLYFSL